MNETETLELEKQKLKLTLSLIDDGVVFTDPSQTIVYVNNIIEEMIGYRLSEVVGKKVGDFLVLLDTEGKAVSADQICPLGEIDMQGAVYKNPHLKLVARTDKVSDVEVESRKMKGGSQIGIGCVVVIKNVAKKRELENMKVDFTSMAVHVLRTPLTILRGFLNELQRKETLDKLDESERENLSNASSGANELNTLIEDLLHLSEIQQGSFKISPTLINYEGLVSSVILSFENIAHAKGLQIIFNPPIYEFPMIRIDIERVKELLANLLGNAIKFTDKGFIEVAISKDDKNITTLIADSGKGIPKERQALVFEKFYREKDNPLAMAEGHGFGLFLCQKIVEAHKGKIWVESREGIGSSFYFTLPIS